MTGILLGVDCSTTATKVVAWNASGENLGEGRCDIPLSTPSPGIYEQNPDDWWDSVVKALRQLGESVDLNLAVALAVSNQRETVCFLDKTGVPVAPAIIWLDERCRPEVDTFAAKIGDEKIHRITGKHKDITPVVYRLAWMRKHAAEVCGKVAFISDVQGFLSLRLTGKLVTSWASADPMGCWDIVNKKWSGEILGALGWSEDNFPAAQQPGTVLGAVTPEAAKQTGLSSGLIVVAGGGDGQCAGLGIGATHPETAYINIGTAVVCGACLENYVFAKAWRTMTAMSGGYIVESCLRSGTFLVNWLLRDIFKRDGGADDFDELENNAARLPPGSEGLSVLPYWSGVMNPHWNPGARGAIFGLSGHHRQEHLYRAVIEGIALDQAFCLKQMTESGLRAKQYFAVGGGAQSDLWCQIFADALNGEVCRLDTVEASSLGAAIAAAVGAEIYRDFDGALNNMRGKVVAKFKPGDNAADYAGLLSDYAALYPAAQSTQQQ